VIENWYNDVPVKKVEKIRGLGEATVLDESTGIVVRRHELHFQFDAEAYREWVAQTAVWLEDEGEEDSPPPSGGSCNMRDPCCKGVRKHSCKEIGDGDSEHKGGSSGNEGVSREIDHGDQRSFAANSGSHSPPDPAPLEGHRDRVHERRVPCVSGPAANEKIENDDLTTNRKNNDVSKILHARSVCAPICAPLCNTVANVANVIRPLPGGAGPAGV